MGVAPLMEDFKHGVWVGATLTALFIGVLTYFVN